MVLPIAALVFIFGLILGSFASALMWRIPRGLSVIQTSGKTKDGHKVARSACPHCGTKLCARDLVPLFSWLSTKGRCRHCGKNIGAVYPLTELACGLAAAGLYLSYGLTLSSVLLVLLLPFLAAMFVIDLRHMVLPDALTVICAVLGFGRLAVLYAAADYDWLVPARYICAGVFYAVFAFVLAFLMSKIMKRDAMGMGDVKFFFVAGLFLGFSYFSVFLILSGVCGVLCGVLWQKLNESKVFPFGPALILSFYACLVLQGLGIVPFVGV